MFTGYFFLSSYLPLLWGESLARYQLFNLESLHPLLGAASGVLGDIGHRRHRHRDTVSLHYM